MEARYAWDVEERFDSDVFNENLCDCITRASQEPASAHTILVFNCGYVGAKVERSLAYYG